ncbi:MAG: gamma-glutamylcyclotransferase [Spirochaetales bacterium]|nr:gamma-glutamylcyclotransferase [Spirochaetales bacterium]
MEKSDYLLVYGTLRQGASHEMFHILAEYCEFFSEGFVRGTLYDRGEYPGIVLSADSPATMKGEIREVFTSGSETVRAWIYLYNHDVSTLKVIESGDYLKKKVLSLWSGKRLIVASGHPGFFHPLKQGISHGIEVGSCRKPHCHDDSGLICQGGTQ